MNYYLEAREASKNKLRIILISILIITILFVFYKMKQYNNDNFYNAEAIVTEIKFFRDTYSVMYKYEVEGEEYQGNYLEQINLLLPKEGETIKIRYSKQNYSESKPNLTARYVKHVIIILIGLSIIVVVYRIKKR